MKSPFILRLIPALILAWPAYSKLTGETTESQLFMALGMEPLGRILIGLLEATAVILLLLPASSPYGAVLALGVMCGAVIAHLTVLGVSGQALLFFCLALVNTVACLIIIYQNRSKLPIVCKMFDNETDENSH